MKRVNASTLLNRPLALADSRASVLGHQLQNAPAMSLFDDDDYFAGSPLWRDGSIAIIGIAGVLLDGKGGWGYPYLTWYGDIADRLEEALADEAVSAIVLHVNSPGGMVAGCFDLADRIYSARNIKPIVAILAEEAYSAAYALASATQSITVPRTGGTGSIGVIMLHTEVSRMLDKAGIDVTVFRYGAHKAELSSVEPVTDGARERTQQTIDQLGEIFVEQVARNRGLSPDAIRAMEAETFLGADGVANGLADAVMSPDAALLALRDAVP